MKGHSQKLISILLLVMLLVTLVTGCSCGDEKEPKSEISETPMTQITPDVPAQSTPTQPQTVTVVDQTGISVTIPANVQRVVSVYPMATLIVYSLGGQDELVGIDSFSPKNEVLKEVDPNISKITPVGMPWEVNVETVVSLNPDVVLGGFGDVREALENANLPVIGINLESPEKLKEGINLIGKCIGKEDEAEALVAYYDQKTDTIISRTREIPQAERIRVLIPNKTGKLSCAGGDTYQQYLIEGAGGINVAEEVTGRWPQASLEQIMLWNPHVIIVPPYCKDKPEDILSDSAWQDIDAVKNGRVYLMPEYTVAWDTPVPDSILGELWIAKKLYPERFSGIDINAEADEFYTRFYGTHYKWQKTVVDSLDNEVTIPSYVESVASLRAGITEIICALGQKSKILAVENGVKEGAGYGAFITSIHPDLMNRDCPVAGHNVNLEEMLRIDPDLILIGGYGRMKWVEPLEKTNIPVAISHFETLEAYMDDIRIVAQCINAEDRAEELVEYLEGKLDFINSKVKDVPQSEKVRVLFGGHDTYHVYGGNTFEHSQILTAGGSNVAEGLAGWLPEVSPEQIINWDPQVIVVLNGTSTENILNDSKIADISAVKNGRVYALPEAGWDFASPRALFCIEWLAGKLYPERFKDVDIIGEADEFYQNVYGVNYSGPLLTATRPIIDMKGRRVEIPAQLNRVVSVFPYVTFTMLALGGEDILAGVDTASSENANLAEIYPKVTEIPAVGSAFNVNKESVLLANPDIVLTVIWDRDPDKTQSMIGVPVVCVDLNYYKESINFIARVIRAQDKAKEFTSYYDTKMAYIADNLSDVPQDKKTKVYIAGGKGMLSTFGKESTWHYEIGDACGVNVAEDVTGGGSHEVSMEQVLIWNPDVVILDKSCGDSIEAILSDTRWQSINAIKSKRIYRAPDGFLDTWGRPHMESALARVWLADKLYPDKLEVNTVEEARDFYSKFYGITLSDQEIEKILNPE
ncbi:MAG: ABC transporter substrate-binding protein [Chloroflexota bacterium]|nr:ABC transporter substrate-binding protein [Chloroflexota bacterium]